MTTELRIERGERVLTVTLDVDEGIAAHREGRPPRVTGQ